MKLLSRVLNKYRFFRVKKVIKVHSQWRVNQDGTAFITFLFVGTFFYFIGGNYE